MRRMLASRLIIFATLAALLMAGCAKKPAAESMAPAETPVVTETPAQQEVSGIRDGALSESAVTEAPAAEDGSAAMMEGQAVAGLQPVYFDFDQYTLTPQARETLAQNAAFLNAHQQMPILIEGHTDERGSDEYNLALGERRARATRDYLISLGVAGDRLSILSYGEERPAAQGNTEEAYSKNRRAEFVAR